MTNTETALDPMDDLLFMYFVDNELAKSMRPYLRMLCGVVVKPILGSYYYPDASNAIFHVRNIRWLSVSSRTRSRHKHRCIMTVELLYYRKVQKADAIFWTAIGTA